MSSLFHNKHSLSFKGILYNLPVYIRRQWFDVRSVLVFFLKVKHRDTLNAKIRFEKFIQVTS